MSDRIPGTRSSISARAAGAALVAVLLTLVAVPTWRAEAAEAPVAVTGGTISWGLKASFRSYLTSAIAHGEVTATSPASDDGTRSAWGAASGQWAEGDADVEASGSVSYVGHGGELDLTIANPRLVVDGSSAELRIDATDSAGTRTSGLVIATVDLAGRVTTADGRVTVSGAPTTLTAAGATFMGDFYAAGSALDPLEASLLVEEASTEPTTAPTTEPSTAPTTEPSTVPTTEPTTVPTAGSDDVTAGSISWGLKASFRAYLTSPIAGGAITATLPATDDGTRTTFRSATGTWTDSRVDVRTAGSVRFAGHHGQLDLTISTPRLVLDGTGARLVVDAKDSSGTRHAGLAVANVDLHGRVTAAGDTVTVKAAPATLTKAGESLFAYDGASFYEAGTHLEPVSATFEVENAVVPTTAPVTAAPTPKPTAVPTTAPTKKSSSGRSGALTWGVKASFRSYITGPIAKGSVSVSAGASAVSGGYRFGQGSTTAQPPNARGTTGYRGAVRFSGHHGELDMVIARPSVRVTSATSAVLSAQVAGRGRLDLAVLDLGRAGRTSATGWVQYANASAALTAAGSSLFSYNGTTFYPAGTVVDPVTFSIGTTAGGGSGSTVVSAATADDWTAPATPPATTGLSVGQDEIRAGDEITASGSGFQPNESGIRVVLYSSPVVLAEDVTADASGRATWTGTIPATLEAGRHTLTFQGSVDRGIVIDVAAAEEITGCRLSAGRLDWGFKESFRAYVSGSIANGDWTTTGHASYATPQFTWSKGEGVRAADTGAGHLDFTGGIEFTGHDGALDTMVSDPVVTFAGEDAAVLSVDYSGTTMDAAMAGDDTKEVKPDVPFADLDLAAGTTTTEGSTVTIADIPATLTTAGSAAFPNYEAGTVLDPVTLTFTVAQQCDTVAAPVAGADAGAASVAGATTGAAGSALPSWVAWVGGALLGGALACVATVLVMRRRTPGAGA